MRLESFINGESPQLKCQFSRAFYSRLFAFPDHRDAETSDGSEKGRGLQSVCYKDLRGTFEEKRDVLLSSNGSHSSYQIYSDHQVDVGNLLQWIRGHVCVGKQVGAERQIVPICDGLFTMLDPALDCESFGTTHGGRDPAGLLVGLPTVACD